MNFPKFHKEIESYHINFNKYLPALSEITMEAHYHHYQKYCDNLYIIADSVKVKYPTLRTLSLEEIVKNYPEDFSIYNNAAQILNHQIYWSCLKPEVYIKNIQLDQIIEQTFGSIKNLLNKSKNLALSHFGSGWLWCIQLGNRLELITTKNAKNPLSSYECNILFGIDLWEHAFYIEHKWEKDKYLEQALEQLNFNYLASKLKTY